MRNLKNYSLELIVFISGAIIMIFELAGSRVLGPYLGTSIFIWTSIIGIIMGSLSLGYYLGGRIADKKPHIKNLAFIIFIAALFIGLTILIKDITIVALQAMIKDIKLTAVFASIVLFTPTSILLGMVSPYAVRLKMDKVATSGTTVGNLYALSTVGSIVGTFTAGFYLIPTFGTTNILFILALILIAVSALTYIKTLLKTKIIALGLLVVLFSTTNYHQYVLAQNGYIDVDTQYSRIQIWDDDNNGNPIRRMQIENTHSSAMFLKSDELTYEYTKYYNLAEHFNPDFKKTLMIGGAAYSYPKHFLNKYPNATIDVIEIDPKLTELAKKYFKLEDNPRLNIYHEDGRTFLNNTNNKYDAIFGDAFKAKFIPYQLTTKEFIQKAYNSLNDDGVVILNIATAIEGDQGKFLRAEYTTYKSIFPQVYLFTVQEQNVGNIMQNIILVALKSEEKPTFYNDDYELNTFLNRQWKKEITNDVPILTDDFAPVYHYISDLT